MAQTRYNEYQQANSTAMLNSRNAGFANTPGLYAGFDWTQPNVPETNLILVMTGTGFTMTDPENSTIEKQIGVVISKQLVAIHEDDSIVLPISPNSSGSERTDLIICTHTRVETPGGVSATYSVVEGTPGEDPPSLPDTHSVLIGYLTMPAGALDLSYEDVRFRKSVPPYADASFIKHISSKGNLQFDYLTPLNTLRDGAVNEGLLAYDVNLKIALPSNLDTFETGIGYFNFNPQIRNGLNSDAYYTSVYEDWLVMSANFGELQCQIAYSTKNGGITQTPEIIIRSAGDEGWGNWFKVTTGLNEPTIQSSNGTLSVSVNSTPSVSLRKEYDIKATAINLGIMADLNQFFDTGTYVGQTPCAPGMSYQNMLIGAFDATATYSATNKIWFDGRVWECVSTTSAGNTPYTNPSKWTDLSNSIGSTIVSTTLFVTGGFLNSSVNSIELYIGQSFTVGKLTYYTPTNTVYTCTTNASAGENPVSNPAKWTAYPGGAKLFNQFYSLDVVDFVIPANADNPRNIRYQRQRITVSNNFQETNNKAYRSQVWERINSQEVGYSAVYGYWVQLSNGPTLASYNSLLV